MNPERQRILGIFGLLVMVVGITAALNPDFLGAYNLGNILRWTALFGVLSLGAALVIMTGGIDLSLGSMAGLAGALLPWLLRVHGWPAWAAMMLLLAGCALLGLLHGVLVTRLRLAPFVVTLCGLLIYRGAARTITSEQVIGYGVEHEQLRLLATGSVFGIPAPLLLLVGVALLTHLFLARSVAGRWLLATGRNPAAARLCGVPTNSMITLAYVLCAMLAGLGGMLFSLDLNSVTPAQFGQSYELYAIAAAVLGGCSLRGGEGTVLGVLIGTAVIRVLYNATNLLGIPTQLEFAIIGGVILLGVTADELLRRLRQSRSAL
ncbi:MAG: ABC transporter permease [Planctomycetes bacterium]|nr:ABC transporter permease [Planctomycetota bacterium]